MDALKSQRVLQELVDHLPTDRWWLLCQTDLGGDGLINTYHHPLANVNILLVNTKMCKETGRVFFLFRRRSGSYFGQTVPTYLSALVERATQNCVVQMSRIGHK